MDFYNPNNPFDTLRQIQHNGPVGVFNIKKPPPIVINSELPIMLNWLKTNNKYKYTMKNLPLGAKIFTKNEEDYNATLLQLDEVKAKYFIFRPQNQKT